MYLQGVLTVVPTFFIIGHGLCSRRRKGSWKRCSSLGLTCKALEIGFATATWRGETMKKGDHDVCRCLLGHWDWTAGEQNISP